MSVGYDPDSARMVECVFMEMFMEHPNARAILIEYYQRSPDDAAEDVAARFGVSRRTLFRRLDAARGLFSMTWACLFYDIDT